VVVTTGTETVGRDRWLRLYPVVLGMGGLGAAWQPSMISTPLGSVAVTSTERMVVTALLALSIRAVHHESPSNGALAHDATSFSA
jgi:hypothetical protein